MISLLGSQKLARREFVLVGALIITYTIFFASLASAQHAAHRTSVFDLGVYDQVIWNTAQGRILTYSAEPEYGDNFLATHLQLILVALAPLYWLWSDVRGLFITQTLALALSTMPIYALARHHTQSVFSAFVLCAAYLLWPAVEAANLFDYHPETFAPLFCLTLFWLLEKLRAHPTRRTQWLCAMLLILTLAIKEDMALIVAMLGLYVAVFRRQGRVGLVLLATAALWFLVGVYVVMPLFHHGQLSPFLSYYASLGDSPQSIVWNALTKPDVTASLLFTSENGIALLALWLPLAFLPLLDLPIVLIAAPALLLNGLSENPLMHQMEEKHYAAPIIPFVVLAAIYGLARLRALAARLPLRSELWLRGVTIGLLVVSLTYHTYRGYTPLSRLFVWPTTTEHDRIAQTFSAQIPPTASLVAQDRLYPHLSQREQMLYVWRPHSAADYVFMDVAHDLFNNQDDIHAWLKQQLVERGDYGLIDSRDGYLLLRRGAPKADLSPAFFSFTRADESAITQPLHARFGDELELLGFSYLALRDREIQLTLYWRALTAQRTDRFIQLYVLNDARTPIGETRFTQPTLVWYPMSQWRMGQIVRVPFNTVTWTTEGLAHYAIAVAVLDGPTPSQARRALRITPDDARDTVRLLDANRMLQLGTFQKELGQTWLMH